MPIDLNRIPDISTIDWLNPPPGLTIVREGHTVHHILNWGNGVIARYQMTVQTETETFTQEDVHRQMFRVVRTPKNWREG